MTDKITFVAPIGVFQISREEYERIIVQEHVKICEVCGNYNRCGWPLYSGCPLCDVCRWVYGDDNKPV